MHVTTGVQVLHSVSASMAATVPTAVLAQKRITTQLLLAPTRGAYLLTPESYSATLAPRMRKAAPY